MSRKLTDKQKTVEVFDRLVDRLTSKQSLLIKEFRWGSGYTRGRERSIDLFEIEPTSDNRTISYEIKVSRADFLKDIRDHNKQRSARCFSNNFYYVTPKGLLKLEEVPCWAGLIEVDLEIPFVTDNIKLLNHGVWFNHSVDYVLDAPDQSREGPSWTMMVSAFRREPTTFAGICKEKYMTVIKEKLENR